jgi:uncharacterized protein (DUF2062 family)
MNVSDPLNMLAPDGTTRRRKEDSLSMSFDGERLARLETKVDLILEHQESFRRSFEKHDDRLKHLENTKSTIYGIAAAIGALSAFLMDGLRAAILQR